MKRRYDVYLFLSVIYQFRCIRCFFSSNMYFEILMWRCFNLSSRLLKRFQGRSMGGSGQFNCPFRIEKGSIHIKFSLNLFVFVFVLVTFSLISLIHHRAAHDMKELKTFDSIMKAERDRKKLCENWYMILLLLASLILHV